MIPRSRAILPLLLLILLALAPPKAAAATLLPGRETVLDWPRGPDPVVRFVFTRFAAPIARTRILMLEIVLLPTERTVATLSIRRSVASPDTVHKGADPIVMPLPGAMPLLLGALGGLAIIGRRRARRACPV
jgi:hypothetical protein